MLIIRDHRRASAPVADSWQRLERWFASNCPEVLERLRPGVPEDRINFFEQSTGLELPDCVRESFRLHDGKEESYPGPLVGEPLDSLEKCQNTLRFFRSLWEDYEASDTDTWIDAICTSYPEGAIRCQDVNPSWLPMGDWDGNCYGIDLDPGPNGVIGQVINFGRDEQNKFVLAQSWAHFLEDIADELEAGNISLTRDALGEVVSFGRPGHDDQALFQFWSSWSRAKLPAEFQNPSPVPRTATFPGEPAADQTAEEARSRVAAFIRAMHEYELEWLRVRPIHEKGYGLIIEGNGGYRTEGLQMGKASATVADAPNPAPLDQMSMGVHVMAATQQLGKILEEHCTERRRTMQGSLVQVYPPYFDPAVHSIGEVRMTSPNEVLVYVQSQSEATRRYHLRRVNGQWRIDLADETKDHVRFARVSVLFGFH